MTYRAYRKSGKTSHTTTDMGSLMRGPVSPRPFVPGNLSLSTRPPGDVRPSSPRDMPAGPTVAPGRPGPMTRPGPTMAPRGPLRVTPGERQDTGGGRKKVPNRSGDPAGYNSKLFRNNAAIIKAFNALGYPVRSVGQSEKDAVGIRKFQQEFNACSRRFSQRWGAISVNGMMSPDTLRALEIALIFSRQRQRKMIEATKRRVSLAQAWKKSCQKSGKGKPGKHSGPVVRAYSSSRPNVPPKNRWGWRGSPYNIPKPRKRRGGSISTEWATKPKPRDSSIHSTRGQHPAGKHHPILSGWCWDEESEKVWRKGTGISRAAERTSTFYAGPSKYTVLNVAGVGVRRVERCDGYARARSFSSTSRPQPRDSVGYIRSRNPLHKRTKAQRWRR